MNPIAEEISSYYGIAEDNNLKHYGMPRRSGRYPWGSGEDPYQHNRDFLSRVEEMREQGYTYFDKKTGKLYTGDTAIAKGLKMTTTQFRTEISLCNNERKMLKVARAKSLKEDGLNTSQIAREMGVNESTVRGWFKDSFNDNLEKARETADIIQKRVDEVGMVDVSAIELNISKEKLNQALYLLEKRGYPNYMGGIPQVTNPGQQTHQRVVCPPGTEHKEIYDYKNIHSLNDYISRDNGETYEKKFTYPSSLDSSRMKIRYAEEGGIDKDGIIELRRNVPDLSLEGSRYSQVRILVDGTHFLKGMAVYSDNMPDGVDVIFNTNKKQGMPMTEVLKKIKDDPDNPFGSTIKDADQGGQYWYTDPKTGEKKLGLINKRSDEGDWSDWKDALPSQFLGKQSLYMAKRQLDIAKDDKFAEFDEYCSLTNPTIKKHLLDKFADGCDSAAVHLQAAALPGQKYHAIVPINTLKDTEVYAPNYASGTKLALVRYPHAGIFEIPILTVNNKHAAGKEILGTDAVDAVGINCKVAAQLSGADFDGDTVMCIPTHDPQGKVKIASRPYLKELVGFDPKDSYQYHTKDKDPDGTEHYYRNGTEFRTMSKKAQQTQMGVVSNLITDMTLAGANDAELAAAVRHSMVVIDAEKHKLDYKQSELDNNIAALHLKYQGKATGGAATILSKAKGEQSVLKRQGNPYVNVEGKKGYDPSRPEGALIYKVAEDKNLLRPVSSTNTKTGIRTLTTIDGKKVQYNPADEDERALYTPIKKVNKDTGEVTFTNKSGTLTYKTEERMQKSTKMAEVDDAYELVSEARRPMELLYADYANSMKSLANRARMESVTTGKIEYSKSAANAYREEVESLNTKLKIAQLNASRERAAQRMANAEIQEKLDAGQIEKTDTKKVGQRAIKKYREEVSAQTRKERNIEITDNEWNAIQAGAITESKLKQILDNTDIDKLRERATPRTTTTITTVKQARIENLRASGRTLNEIAEACGLSVSAVSNYLNNKKKGVN